MDRSARTGSNAATALAGHALQEPPTALLDDPLEFLLVQQLRQRALCVVLRQIAAKGVTDVGSAKQIVTMLTRETVLHQEDEEIDLLPLLRRRATVEDNLEGLIAQMRAEAHRLRRTLAPVIHALSAEPTDGMIRILPHDATMIVSYATQLQRRLAAEHGILMVLARKRLTAKDIKTLGESMKRRRNDAS